jgi:hypothetical protein
VVVTSNITEPWAVYVLAYVSLLYVFLVDKIPLCESGWCG